MPRQLLKVSDWQTTSIFALGYEVVLQFLVGIYLSLGYHPGVNAFKNVHDIRSSEFGSVMSGIHYWGSAILIIHAFLHLTACLWSANYRQSTGKWFGAILLFIGAFIAQVSGNLLPMDRHGVQTAVVETGLIGSFPIIGKSLHHIAIDGSQLSLKSVALWFQFHEIIVALIFIGALSLLYFSRSKLKRSGSKIGALLPIAAVIIIAFVIKPPLGNAAQAADFSEFNAHVSWYTWPLHGMLQVFEHISASLGWVGFMLLPLIFILFLVLVPALDREFSNIAIRLIFSLFVIGYALAGVFFGGPIASLTGNRDPAPDAKPLPGNTKNISAAQILLAKAGQSLFNSVGCSGCHGTNGTNGDSAPDLTSLWQQHDSSWFQKLIQNPKSVNSSATMPAFSNLSPDQLAKLGAFLSTPQTAVKK